MSDREIQAMKKNKAGMRVESDGRGAILDKAA